MPIPDRDAQAFWVGLVQHELRILRCRTCEAWIHYPLAICPRCQSFDVAAEVLDGQARVYSYSIVRREFVPGIKPPYAAALVELKAAPEVRLLTNLVKCTFEEIEIGMLVQPVYFDVNDEVTLLYFEPMR